MEQQSTVRLVQKMTNDYRQNVLKRISDGTKDDNIKGCRLWVKSVSKKHYPKMKISIDGDRSDQFVHRLVYFIEGHQDMDNHHVSHLCHNRLCVRRAHLNLEWSYINKNRDICKAVGECSGHTDHPKCIVIWFILSSCTIFMTNACFSTETPVVSHLYQDTPNWTNHYFNILYTPITCPTIDDIFVLLHGMWNSSTFHIG